MAQNELNELVVLKTYGNVMGPCASSTGYIKFEVDRDWLEDYVIMHCHTILDEFLKKYSCDDSAGVFHAADECRHLRTIEPVPEEEL